MSEETWQDETIELLAQLHRSLRGRFLVISALEENLQAFQDVLTKKEGRLGGISTSKIIKRSKIVWNEQTLRDHQDPKQNFAVQPYAREQYKLPAQTPLHCRELSVESDLFADRVYKRNCQSQIINRILRKGQVSPSTALETSNSNVSHNVGDRVGQKQDPPNTMLHHGSDFAYESSVVSPAPASYDEISKVSTPKSTNLGDDADPAQDEQEPKSLGYYGSDSFLDLYQLPKSASTRSTSGHSPWKYHSKDPSDVCPSWKVGENRMALEERSAAMYQKTLEMLTVSIRPWTSLRGTVP
ncbi:MAG: hypothetical protein Q9170_004269 [Blastenia crenularia]